MIVALDVETSCKVGCTEKCEHALDHNRSKIDLIGIYYEVSGFARRHVFKSVSELTRWQDANARSMEFGYVGHNFKFDARVLFAHGYDALPYWVGDTQLLAVSMAHKIPELWLAKYDEQRRRLNESLPHGYSHRPATKHSLKTLAPYWLNVAAFWEDPTNHNSAEYVLKDCEYTYRLYEKLRSKANRDEYAFYSNKLLPWTRMLYKAEIRGIKLDLGLMERMNQEAKQTMVVAEDKLRTQYWAHPIREWTRRKEEALQQQYDTMLDRQLEKIKQERHETTKNRYYALYEKAASKLETFNFNSPAQLNWLLKDYYGLHIESLDTGEESTGKEVLNRLASLGREDVKTFLEYRKATKLSQAFFPSYNEMHNKGVLHTTFNPSGTRTGRLSCSSPNLQQVAGDLHKLFVFRLQIDIRKELCNEWQNNRKYAIIMFYQ